MPWQMERASFLDGNLVSLLLAILCFVTYFTFYAAAQSTDVYIIDLVFKTKEFPPSRVEPFKHGFNASLSSRDFAPAGRNVKIISREPTPNEVASCIEGIIKDSDDLFIVLGPASAPHALNALATLKKKNVVAFGPITELSTVRKWDEHLYFFFLKTSLLVHALLRHAVINLRVRRIGFMHTTNVCYGDSEFDQVKHTMRGLKRELCGVFSVNGSKTYAADNDEFNERWEAFAETRPQAVIIVSRRNSAAHLFVEKMLKDPRTSSAYLMVATFLERMTLGLWEKAKKNGAAAFPGQVITTTSFPSPLDNSSAMIRKFSSVIDKYFDEEVEVLSDQEAAKIAAWKGNIATFAGWLAGEILFRALSGFSASLERKDFIASLYDQRSYIIEDFVLGTFGGNISEELEKAGAVARCNEGAITAYIVRYEDAKTSKAVPEGFYRHPLHICQTRNLTLFDSAGIVTLNITDFGSTGVYFTKEIAKGYKAGNALDTSVMKHNTSLLVIQSTSSTIPNTVRKEYEKHWTNIVIGLMDEAALDTPNLVYIDPVLLVARMNKFRRETVFLSPTVDQQIFVFAEYVASLRDQTLRAIIRSLSAKDALEMVKMSFLTFGMTLTSSVLLEGGGSVETELAATGFTLLIEVEEEDIPVFLAHLERHKGSRLVILFNPLLGFYEKLCAAFNGTEAGQRLLIVTNLPHWADEKSSLQIIRKYHKQIRNSSEWSPLSLQNFIVGSIIRLVVEELDVVSWTSVIDYFYKKIAVNLDEMNFGPYSDKNSVTCTSTSDPNSLACAKNFGAAAISVWPMIRVFDPTVSVLFGPVTPSMEYRLPSNGLTKTQLIAVIVCSLVGAAVLAVVVVVLITCLCTSNTNAPKNNMHPVTLIFTDIQSSTALWAACPEIMTDAVDTHHRLIRRLIAKHRCYEVKTVGDSFMIACKNPYSAVQLVGELQRTFLQYDWGTSAIDEMYREFEERWAEEDADYEPPTARLNAAVYRAHWRGLRVRAGVHTGLSDIRHDEVTKRYDYYGSTSNTAARTESIAHGGQVLLTRAAFMALSAAERVGLDVTSLGAVELRGVPEPVEMLQLNAVPGRTFAKLRLERANDDFDFETRTPAGMDTSGDDSETLSPAAENIFTVFKESLAPFPPQKRLKILEPFCRQWHVTVPDAKSEKELFAASHLAKQRLATKVSRVVERRQMAQGTPIGLLENISILRGSFSVEDSPKPSFLRTSSLSNFFLLRSPRTDEQHSRSPRVTSIPLWGSLDLSSTSSIHVREPSVGND